MEDDVSTTEDPTPDPTEPTEPTPTEPTPDDGDDDGSADETLKVADDDDQVG